MYGINTALQAMHKRRLRRDGTILFVLRIADRDTIDPQVIQGPGESVPDSRGIVVHEVKRFVARRQSNRSGHHVVGPVYRNVIDAHVGHDDG